jgi:threonine/homoserine/homoserine lactone efflux protein
MQFEALIARMPRSIDVPAHASDNASMSLAFLLTSLIVIVSPGTGVLYTLAAALTRGSRASVAAAFGCTLGIVPHMLAAMLGLAAVLHTSALAFLPQFVAVDESRPLVRMLELSAAFMAMTFAVFVVYGLFAASVRDRIVTRPKAMTWLRRAFARRFCRAGSEAGAGGTLTASAGVK